MALNTIREETMNVLEMLQSDHNQMRMKIMRVSLVTNHQQLRNQFKEFILSYEEHESFEDEVLFPEISDHLGSRGSVLFLHIYGRVHRTMWEHMDELLNTIDHKSRPEVREALEKFQSLLESHLRQEEHYLFPMIRKVADIEFLESLGAQFEQRHKRFTNAVC